jgi:hypothetical protein
MGEAPFSATPRLSHRPLADRDLERCGRAASDECQLSRLAGAVRAKKTHYFSYAIDLLGVPIHDDVADEQTSARSWSIWIDAHHENTTPTG